MDNLDKKILNLLQKDSSQPIADIAKKVGLSASPCWKRIKKMISDGVIIRQCAHLDYFLVGFGLIAFVSIKTKEHSDNWLQNFSNQICLMPEVLEFYRMAGDVDYMLKVVAKDINAFDKFYKELVKIPGLSEVTSRFSMEKIKDDDVLPL